MYHTLLKSNFTFPGLISPKFNISNLISLSGQYQFKRLGLREQIQLVHSKSFYPKSEDRNNRISGSLMASAEVINQLNAQVKKEGKVGKVESRKNSKK